MTPYCRFDTPETQQAFLDLGEKADRIEMRTTPMTEEERVACISAFCHIWQMLGKPSPVIHFVKPPIEASLLMMGTFKKPERDFDRNLAWEIRDVEGINNLADTVSYRLHERLFDEVLDRAPKLFNPRLDGPYIKVPANIDFGTYPNMKHETIRPAFSLGMPFAIRDTLLRSYWLHSYLHLYVDPEIKQHKAIHDLKFMCHDFAMTHKTVCIIDFPKSITFDDQQRLHSEDGASIVYLDDVSYYYWHGQPVPVTMFTEPLTPAVIDKGRNAEIRRAMIEKYGLSKYLQECGVVTDNAVDEVGSPLRLYWRKQRNDEPIVMLEMTNSTVDPDGSVRTYMRRVPPEMTSAIEARNWVCGLPHGSRIDVQS